MSNSPVQEASPWLASEMPKENLGDFNLPWCKKFLADPTCKEVPFPSRTITRNSTHHSLFNRTLATNDTLRAAQAFHVDNKEKGRKEAVLLASLGTGLDGHPGMAHGGTTSLIFDEALSLGGLMTLNNAFVTVESTIKYKKPVPTPSVLIIKSWVEKHDGRKCWIEGNMEDGEGNILASARSLFIEVPSSKV